MKRVGASTLPSDAATKSAAPMESAAPRLVPTSHGLEAPTPLTGSDHEAFITLYSGLEAPATMALPLASGLAATATPSGHTPAAPTPLRLGPVPPSRLRGGR